jgi:hypothetical protein
VKEDRHGPAPMLTRPASGAQVGARGVRSQLQVSPK